MKLGVMQPTQLVQLTLAVAIGAFGAIGCGSPAVEPGTTTGAEPASASAPHASTVRGYAHTVEASRFRIGDHPFLEVDAAKLQRWRGANGAFARDPSNGWTMALLDANAPTGEYELDEARHQAAVRAYFVSAGIPEDQIADVKATYEATGGGSQDDMTSRPVRLKSINSILVRSIQGIPVAESYAWAKMTTGGEVDMESVFWPEIDQAVVDKAVALAARLNDEREHAAFKTRLRRPVFNVGGVMIHHSDSSIHETPKAYVSYDATVDSAGSAAMHHFDEYGNEFRLPHEAVEPALKSVKTAR